MGGLPIDRFHCVLADAVMFRRERIVRIDLIKIILIHQQQLILKIVFQQFKSVFAQVCRKTEQLIIQDHLITALCYFVHLQLQSKTFTLECEAILIQQLLHLRIGYIHLRIERKGIDGRSRFRHLHANRPVVPVFFLRLAQYGRIAETVYLAVFIPCLFNPHIIVFIFLNRFIYKGRTRLARQDFFQMEGDAILFGLMTLVKCRPRNLLLLKGHVECPLSFDAIDGMDRDGKNLILVDGFVRIVHLPLEVIPALHFLDGTGTIAQPRITIPLPVTVVDIKAHFPGLILPLLHAIIHKSRNRYRYTVKIGAGQLHRYPVLRHRLIKLRHGLLMSKFHSSFIIELLEDPPDERRTGQHAVHRRIHEPGSQCDPHKSHCSRQPGRYLSLLLWPGLVQPFRNGTEHLLLRHRNLLHRCFHLLVIHGTCPPHPDRTSSVLLGPCSDSSSPYSPECPSSR